MALLSTASVRRLDLRKLLLRAGQPRWRCVTSLCSSSSSLGASKVIVEETKFFAITVSFGSVASSISLPCYMSHASIPAEVRVLPYTLIPL